MPETLEQRIQSLEQILASQPRSPLFAQLASYYLEAGRSQEALTACDNGLAHFPFYTTGHLVKGKTLLALNMRAEARREFEFVHERLPLNQAVTSLLAQIPPTPDELLVETAAPVAEPMVEIPSTPAAIEATTTEAEQILSQFTDQTAEPSTAAAEEQATEAPVAEAPPSSPTEDVFGIAASPGEISASQEVFASEPTEAPSAESYAQAEESFAAFAEGKRGELFGMENSMSLEEYLAEPAREPETPPAPVIEPETPVFSEPEVQQEAAADPFAALTDFAETTQPPVSVTPDVVPSTSGTEEDPFAQLTQPPPTTTEGADSIEQIAEKLKEAKRITPVINLSDRTPAPPSEADTPSETGFVTPTLAEIYAKQGWYDDAIKAYKSLAINKPAEREKYESRIRELEELKRQQASQG